MNDNLGKSWYDKYCDSQGNHGGMTADLTEGNVRQRLIQYALPLVIMNLMQPQYGALGIPGGL